MDFGGGAAPAATRLPRVACFLQVQTPSSRHLVRTHTTQWTLLDLNGLSTQLYQQTNFNSSLMKVYYGPYIRLLYHPFGIEEPFEISLQYHTPQTPRDAIGIFALFTVELDKHPVVFIQG